jgi:endonuclease-3
MPNTTNKTRVLNQLFTTLKSRYGAGEPVQLPVFEQFVYAVCREGTTREQADRAFRTLGERFFDWNEIRVSSAREIEEALRDLPDAEQRAQRLLSLLQEVFETTFSFDLESLHKKGLKQAAKQLARFQAANEYAVAWVIQHALGGHAVPVDGPTLRALRRLGLLDTDTDDPEAVRASLEHIVPKVRGPLFGELISALAEEACWEADPNCPACPLNSECPTGQEVVRDTVVAGRSNRPKPR